MERKERKRWNKQRCTANRTLYFLKSHCDFQMHFFEKLILVFSFLHKLIFSCYWCYWWHRRHTIYLTFIASFYLYSSKFFRDMYEEIILNAFFFMRFYIIWGHMQRWCVNNACNCALFEATCRENASIVLVIVSFLSDDWWSIVTVG